MASGGTPERWWAADLTERYWLEITDREDLGVDLNAPADRETGDNYWSYEFVREVQDGDVVLHYRTRPINAITHWSRAAGEPYRDDVYWGAHGQASGRGPVAPYWRPGWRHPLDGPYPLAEPVSAARLREFEGEIRAVREELRATHPGASLYFPFQLSDTQPLRAFQGYLTKFPAGVVGLISQLAEVATLAESTRPSAGAPAPASGNAVLGAEYRHSAQSSRTARRQPFSVDPNLVDRALEAHARTQEALADAVKEAGLSPRSPHPGEPVFDIAWEDGEAIVLAEVKSLTEENEEKQLRLALGQVLRYGFLLGQKGRPVQLVIAVERDPTDASWRQLCQAAGVTLVSLGDFESLFV